jgi:heparin lyase
MIRFKLLAGALGAVVSIPAVAQNAGLTPITTRVDVQSEVAPKNSIINNEWVAIGINRPHAIQEDATLLFHGKPSYRFELKADDNSLQGYEEGSTKGRAEFSYCYAIADDYKNLPEGTYATDQVLKLVYARGKGQCSQGSKWMYTFSVYIPSSFPADAHTIFAQWHGMPSRTLVQDPSGKIMQLTPQEFVELSKKMTFKNDTGYDLVENADGKGKGKAGNKNGWKIEQGGYPPLAMGFSDGSFYIQANSDSKWMTDKTDRTNANISKVGTMQSVSSQYKTSTIAYRTPFADFPKNKWVTFTVGIDWSVYGGKSENVISPGKLDVVMQYDNDKKQMTDHIVNNEKILIGRNDDLGYYFKFGIYRTNSSTVPVAYNLAGFSQKQLK